jgi:hypothetical protein
VLARLHQALTMLQGQHSFHSFACRGEVCCVYVCVCVCARACKSSLACVAYLACMSSVCLCEVSPVAQCIILLTNSSVTSYIDAL